MPNFQVRPIRIIGVDYGSVEVAIEDGASIVMRVASYESSYLMGAEAVSVTRRVVIEDGLITEVQLPGNIWAKLDRPA